FNDEKKLKRNHKKKVYIMPVFTWDCKDNEIAYNAPSLIIYSKDLGKIYEYSLYRKDNNKFSLLDYGTVDCIDEKALKEKPGREFICVSNIRYHFCISKENEKTGGSILHDLEIKGDYYNKLKEFGIGISFKKLVSEKNLYIFDI
ncbi:MAG: hypothetical protein HFH68_16250, partial [Lachnospiraceae bacterium]|nr:hypothetical protein [Lachnospiraceae bacterium]